MIKVNILTVFKATTSIFKTKNNFAFFIGNGVVVLKNPVKSLTISLNIKSS